MSWFDDIFGQSNDKKKTNDDKMKLDSEPVSGSSNEEVYKRPKGKFRFPIQMEYEEKDKEEIVKSESENQQEGYRDRRFYKESNASFPVNRSRRRRRHQDNTKHQNQMSSTKPYSYEEPKNKFNQQDNTVRKKDQLHDEHYDDDFQKRLSSLHQPKFKASEVPSAIFGMRKQKDLPNSALKNHNSDSYEKDISKKSSDDSAINLSNQQNNEHAKQEVPTYSKTDNTINIENIYASQIVSEIRKEREKKLQKKKQFEKALKEKREKELQNLNSETEKSQIEKQDYMYKEQASKIKQTPDASSTNHFDYSYEESDNKEPKEKIQSSEDACYPDVNDPSTFEFKEIDLGIDDNREEENDATSSDNETSMNNEQSSVQAVNQIEEIHDNHVEPNIEKNIVEENVIEPEVTTDSDIYNTTSYGDDEQSIEEATFEPVEEDEAVEIAHHSVNTEEDVIEDIALEETPDDDDHNDTHGSLEPILKPNNNKKVSPFNVVMTPSDKQKYRQFNQNNSNETSTKRVEETVSQDSSSNTNQTHTKRKGPSYILPPISILDDEMEIEDNQEWLEDKKRELDEAFYHFNVPASVVNMIQGPTVTRFELSVEKGVKVSRITALQDDIKMALAAKDIRIEAPIPGTSLVGIEVPNQSPKKIPLGQMIASKMFQQAESKLTVAMGVKINNEPLLMDIAKTPHALIAGATGSGKSVCINTILTSLIYKNHPDELKLLLIDPKMVELAPYNDLPHLVSPVITDVKAATASLKWAVEEMERRYKRFAELHVRNITAYNKKANYEERMPKIVIVIDELADLMMMSPQEVEQSIARIAQKARACGIHMILATQRPSVNVITGLIKANVPTRISFMVSSSIDSRTILDVGGAEKLLGNGDMLYLGNGMNKPIRVQGAFVSDDEIDETVTNVSKQMKPNYLFKEETLLKKVNEQPADALFDDVCEFMTNEGHISTSLIQRHFQIGYNRAARIIDNLEERGFISGPNGSKPRDVLITKDMLEK